MIRLITVRLLQSLGMVLVAYLFVCLMSASIGQTSFSLELPRLTDPDSNSTVELLLLALPGQALFLLISCFIHRLRLLSVVFVFVAALTALLQCLVFAEVFGNTWSNTEVLGLLGYNMQYLLLALFPGLALLAALEHSPGPRSAA